MTKTPQSEAVYVTANYKVVLAAPVRHSEGRGIETFTDSMGITYTVNWLVVNQAYDTVEGKFAQLPVAIETCNYMEQVLQRGAQVEDIRDAAASLN